MPLRPPSRFRSLTSLALAWAVAFFSPAFAAPATAETNKAELTELKSRIDSLKDEVAKSEASRADAADQLRDMDRAISAASRRLRELAEAQGAVQEERDKLQQQSTLLETQIATQQAQLGKLLHSQYVAGESDTLHRFLGGEDPSQPIRDAYYLQALSRAKADWLASLRNSLREKARLAAAVRIKSNQLAQIEKDSRGEQAELLVQQKNRRSLLERIAARLKAQRKEIDGLKRDESRLSQLVQGLSRIVKQTPRPAAPAPSPKKPASAPTETSVGTEVEAAPSGLHFAHLKGRLRTPLKGNMTHRFGSPRSDGVSSWRGVFIRAGSGEVHAVAPGQVVFADWWKGYGNLIILSHDDDYLTVYGNNESLYKGVGDKVKAGDAIAAVGSSGGNAETGLYFELRFRGQPIDPLKWMNLK